MTAKMEWGNQHAICMNSQYQFERGILGNESGTSARELLLTWHPTAHCPSSIVLSRAYIGLVKAQGATLKIVVGQFSG